MNGAFPAALLPSAVGKPWLTCHEQPAVLEQGGLLVPLL